MRVGIERDGGDFVLPLERGAVERFDIGEDLVHLDALDLHGTARQAIKHECVVGIRTVSNSNLHRLNSLAINSRNSPTAAGPESRPSIMCECGRSPTPIAKSSPESAVNASSSVRSSPRYTTGTL